MAQVDRARSTLQAANEQLSEARGLLGKPKQEAPKEPEEKGLFDRVKDAVSNVSLSDVGHTVLDLAGLVPVLGAPADGINAVWYAAEGDWVNAGLSATGMIPIAGEAATAAKLGNRAVDAVRGADEAVDAARATDTTRAADTPEGSRNPDTSSSRGGRPFMREQFRTIAEIVEREGSHPLEFLVDSEKGNWRSRTHLSMDDLGVQAGHLESRHGLQPGDSERFAVEDAYFNQSDNWGKGGEQGGVIYNKSAVDIGGIPVEKRTALMWEELGYLPKGSVSNAPPHPGWSKPR